MGRSWDSSGAGHAEGNSFVNGRSVDGTGQTASNRVRARRGALATALVATVATVAIVFAAAPVAAAPKESPRKAPTGRAFYVPPEPLPAAVPGKLIWSAPFKAIPGAQAWKVLYHSQALDGSDIAVSGVVVAPTDAAPAGGRPVISWAHGTHGIADQCAPSRRADMVSLLPSIGKVVSQGYVVVATDYEGLGTPGTHPYLVGESEARGALDIVKAAQQIRETGANDKTFVWGQSQGGQAALFAGEIQPTYAPELDLQGVVSGAPVTDATAMFPAAATIPETLGFAVMGLMGMAAAYPDAKIADVLTPAGLEQTKIVDQKCYGAVLDAFKQPVDQVIAHNPSEVPPYPAIFVADSPGAVATAAPQLVYQGRSDDVVYKVFTDKYVQKACALGNTVDYETFSGKDHYEENSAAEKDVLEWMQARLAGSAAPSTC
jgi:alpha-beta hydrolase superfamily lysophospholipase